MKHFFVLSWALLPFIWAACAAQASSYPPEALRQKVYVLHRGAALLAHVESVSLARDIIAYKRSGFLAQRKPAWLEAVITAQCPESSQKKTTTIRLGAEWHEAGYMSEPLDLRTLFPTGQGPVGCPVRGDTPLQIAFTDGSGRWDPAGYNDIVFSMYDFFSSRTTFETGEASIQIELPVWDFLVQEMRR